VPPEEDYEPADAAGDYDSRDYDSRSYDSRDYDSGNYRSGGFDPAPEPESPFEPVGQTGFGASPYDRPYEPASTEPTRPRGYLPEHDPAPGARYPLVPDERAAHHPAPPRPGVSRPPPD